MNILQLPPEVLYTIVAGQSRKKLKVLRQVCRIFNQLVEPLLFSTITLTAMPTRNATLASFYNFLESLANGTTNAGAHVRSLSVNRLTPTPHELAEAVTEAKADGKDLKGSHDEKMKDWLLLALGSLKGVRSVSWILDRSDPPWMRPGIIQYFANLPKLEELYIKRDFEILGDTRLGVISNLKKLRIEGISETIRGSLLDQAVSIISNSPHLTSLSVSDIDDDAGSREGDGLTFNSFFDRLPASSPPLRLTEVISQHIPLRLNAVALRHLKELKSLKLEGNPDGEPDDVEGNEEEDWNMNWDEDEDEEEEEEEEDEEDRAARLTWQPQPVLVGEIQNRRPKSTAFWNKLQLSGIQLEKIDLEVVDHAALGYLSSYCGLRALHFREIGASRAMLVNHIATMFYTEVLPKHVETLEELTLVSSYVSAWSVDTQNLELFSQCKNLKTLHVCWKPGAAGSVETFYSILDLSKTFPHLRSLSISFAYPRSIRGARCGNPYYSCQRVYRTKVKKIFPEYEHVDATKNLYKVKAGGLEFKLRPSEGSDSGYRYQFSPPKPGKKGFGGLGLGFG
ncbi:hypothetical protein BDN72DRAFT_876042 [Pluteus cervinus]|uniref:Uncharacterized protein n=1 Tax=Pluteus cervinus TaxID=181527 RepID=A0ACD3B662_9AGAR|nr:hypothetical protein BDN72DRAFT_876042 [Pluteus cervinus]